MKIRLSIILISIILITVIFSGCSKKDQTCTITDNDGIKTYHNKNIPSDPDFKITPKELFTINGTDENNPDSTRMIINLAQLMLTAKVIYSFWTADGLQSRNLIKTEILSRVSAGWVTVPVSHHSPGL